MLPSLFTYYIHISVLFVYIIFLLGISYFAYHLVFGMKFFPFINLLTGVLLIGIGADDTFVLR